MNKNSKDVLIVSQLNTIEFVCMLFVCYFSQEFDVSIPNINYMSQVSKA